MRLIEIAVEPKGRADLRRLPEALRRICDADALLSVQFDPESGQTILAGETESQLEAVLDRLRDELGIQVNFGALQVAYRETISKTVVRDYAHKSQSGGTGAFARVILRVAPLQQGAGYRFVIASSEGVPSRFLPSVEKGVAMTLETGVIAGFPVSDLEVTLLGGTYHDPDSSAAVFEIAAARCARDAIASAGPILLEPHMRVAVTTPDAHMGEVIGDLTSRRATILGMDAVDGRAEFRAIQAQAPLASMFGYSATLLAMTNGRGEFSMSFDRYDCVPISGPDPDFPGAAAVGIP